MPHPTETSFIGALYGRVQSLLAREHEYSDLEIRALEVELFTVTNLVEDLTEGSYRTLSFRAPLFAAWRAPPYLHDSRAAADLIKAVSWHSLYQGDRHSTLQQAFGDAAQRMEGMAYTGYPDPLLARCLVARLLENLKQE